MLATLLPGLRNVRTPLAAGYLYFLAIWLLLGPSRLIPDDSDDGAAGRLAELIDVVGNTATLTAVTFAAYLAGSIVVIKNWPFGIPVMRPTEHHDHSGGINNPETEFFDTFRTSSQSYPAPWAEGLFGWAADVLDDTAHPLTYRRLNDSPDLPRRFFNRLGEIWREDRAGRLERVRLHEVWDKATSESPISGQDQLELDSRLEHLSRDAVPADSWEMPDYNWITRSRNHPFWEPANNLDEQIPEENLTEVFNEQIDDEIKLVTNRLRAQNPHVFDDYDRLVNEAELRYSIVIPLAAIAVTAAITWNWWALALLVLPAVLLRQAYTTERKSVVEVLAAIQYGNITSPTAVALQNARHPMPSPQQA